MTDKFKAALDSVHADDRLKTATKIRLRHEIQRRRIAAKTTVIRRIAAAAFFVIIFISGAFGFNAYYTASVFVDVDINPSIELVINRFDRIIGVYAYNDGGENILENLSIKHKSYSDALLVVLDALSDRGYVQETSLLTVTLQTDDKIKESTLLTAIQLGIENYLIVKNSAPTELEIFPVSAAIRDHSHKLDISPAKYLAIQELLEVDPTATLETCRGHSISEIKRLAKSHTAHHGRTETTVTPAPPETAAPAEEDNQRQNKPQRNQGKGGGHHGGRHHSA